MLKGDVPSFVRILTGNKITEKLRLARTSEGHLVQPLTQDVPPRAGSPRPCTGSLRIFPKTQAPQHLWTTCARLSQ